MSVEREDRIVNRREAIKEALAGLVGLSVGFLTGRLTTPPARKEVEIKPESLVPVEVDLEVEGFYGKTSISSELLETDPLLRERVELIAHGDLILLGALLTLDDPELIHRVLSIISIKRIEAVEEILKESPELEERLEALKKDFWIT